MRKKDGTLRDVLLAHARALADAEGIGAVNMRAIAQKAGVATGTVYNYFSSKDEILLALTEEYWEKTLQEMETAIAADSFCDRLEKIFAFLRGRIDESAGILMRSLENVESAGQARMASMQKRLEDAMIRWMEEDGRVRADIWDEEFTKPRCAQFILMNLTLLLRTKTPDLDFFITVVRRTIY